MVDPGVHDGVGWKAGIDGLVARRRYNAGLGAAWRGLVAAGVVEARTAGPPLAIRDWGAAGGSLAPYAVSTLLGLRRQVRPRGHTRRSMGFTLDVRAVAGLILAPHLGDSVLDLRS